MGYHNDRIAIQSGNLFLAAMAFVFLSTAIWKDVDYACHQTVWASYKIDKAIAETMEQITR